MSSSANQKADSPYRMRRYWIKLVKTYTRYFSFGASGTKIAYNGRQNIAKVVSVGNLKTGFQDFSYQRVCQYIRFKNLYSTRNYKFFAKTILQKVAIKKFQYSSPYPLHTKERKVTNVREIWTNFPENTRGRSEKKSFSTTKKVPSLMEATWLTTYTGEKYSLPSVNIY